MKNKNQNHSIQKAQSLGNGKKNQYTKHLAKNRDCAIFHVRDTRKNVLSKLTKLCMETPCWFPFEGHKYGRRKQKDSSVFEFFFYKSVNSSLEELE